MADPREASASNDERVLVKSFYQGEDYLYRLVKMLSGGGS